MTKLYISFGKFYRVFTVFYPIKNVISIERQGNAMGAKEKTFTPCIANLHGDDVCCIRSLSAIRRIEMTNWEMVLFILSVRPILTALQSRQTK